MARKDWYEKHLAQIKQKAGARYTPVLNVNLPISEIFDGISRTETFYTNIRGKYGELLREFRRVTSKYEKDELQTNYDQTRKQIEALFKLIEGINGYDTNQIPWDKIEKQSKDLYENLWNFTDELRKERDHIKNIKTPPRDDGRYRQSPSEKINSDIHHIYKSQEIIRHFENLSASTKSKLSNNPFLLLTGSAGTGKTHLLCDIVEHRIKNKESILPSSLLFGEYFSSDKDFWSQALVQLEIGSTIKTEEDFLKKLDDSGKKAKCRSLLIVDALNENISYAPDFWKKNLTNIIKEVKKYPNIALIVSVRSGFEKEVLTKKQEALFVHEEHHGFRFREWEAVRKFFTEFSLPLPEIPLLMPEFQIPLFLLLFCKAFQQGERKPNKKIFRGIEGATYIFESFTLNATDRIAREFKIHKDGFKSPAYRIWSEVIKEMASEMVNLNDERIPEERLNEVIQKAYPEVDVGKFAQALESNMLIVKVPRYTEGRRDGGFDIRFPFQKFSDHLIGRYIFKKYEEEFGKSNKNLETAKKFFSKRRKLGKSLAKTWRRGIIEALSTQCPEQLKGIEFIEVAPYLTNENYLAQMAGESFVESLIWRNPKAFSKDRKNTLKVINQNIIRTKLGHEQLLNAFMTVAPIPDHPFNAEFLHQHLFRFSMPERDSWWSTFLHYQHGKQGAVDRLLQWSWSEQDKSHLNDESIFLTSIALSWFLTTPNRFVRDKATKGLVCLLQNRIHLIPKLLEHFKDVTDPYILERLFAVAYGCALRNQEGKENLKTLAEWVYENIFVCNKPPVHILLRDYARGVIEVALSRGIGVKINEDNINPPYKSVWPKRIPSEDELKKKYYPKDSSKGKPTDRDYSDIWFSVFGFGDFASYVIGTNSGSSEWSGRKLDAPEPNRKKLLGEFKGQLSAEQKVLLEKAINPFFGIDLSEISKQIKVVDPSTEKKLSEEEIKQRKIQREKEKQEAVVCFEKSLPEEKKSYFKKEIKPFLDDRGSINDPLENFDLSIAQRWIFNRVVELGYDPKLHGEFDERVNYHNNGRSDHKAERIGKKYQWIAYHEFMALLADHFEFKGDKWGSSEEDYKGPWNPWIRNIDPSFILQNDGHIKDSVCFSQWKTSHGHYDAWAKTKSDVSWMKTDSDLPNPKNIIRIVDDSKTEWLVLEGIIKWEEGTPPEYKKYDVPVREVWYMLKSYIVKKDDAKKFFEWAKKQNFMGRWMPESSEFYEIFIGEYPDSLAFEDLRDDYNIWTKSGRESKGLQIPVVVTDDFYLNEFSFDCSHTGSISIKLPCKWLVNVMKLQHRYLDGRFFDKKGNLIALTTSVFDENVPSKLLINKQALIDFLDKKGYAIFWTLLGEKQLIGGSLSGKDFVGRLEISGAYTISPKENIIGKVNHKFKK